MLFDTKYEYTKFEEILNNICHSESTCP